MRRRRHVLQVSTFPFLAVLLCAMGSLVLLLFIMDRRAKIAARNRVVPVKQEAAPVEPVLKFVTYDDSREKSEYKRWVGDSQRLRQILADLEKRISQGRIELKKLKANLSERQNALQQESTQLKQMQSDAKKKYHQNVALAKRVADELTDLSKIQEIVRTLAKRKSNQQESYSIVPYFGKRGDERKPIYMEVVGDSVIVHPQRATITVIPASFTHLRNAFHEQIRKLTGDQKPYVLFLVRPSGISAYYRAMQVIRSMKIEFGYELIDGDWKLDLTPKATAAAIAALGKKGVGALGNGKRYASGEGPYRPGGNAKSGDGKTPNGWKTGSGKGPYLPGVMAGKKGNGTGPHSPGGTTTKKDAGKGPNAPGGAKTKKGTGKGPNAPGGAKATKNAGKGKTPNPKGVKNGQSTEPGNGSNGGNQGGANLGGKVVKRPPQFERFIGNRKFVITVDCVAEGVVVYPGGQRFDADSFLQPNAEKHPICDEVRQLVARRQATLAPDEPPYRPSILLRVRPEGRRSYFFAYPVLGTLGLPMVQSRSN